MGSGSELLKSGIRIGIIFGSATQKTFDINNN